MKGKRVKIDNASEAFKLVKNVNLIKVLSMKFYQEDV